MFTKLSILLLLPIVFAQNGEFQPKPGYFPATGDDINAGGIFCISLRDYGKYTKDHPAGVTGSESPKAPGAVTSGSGPYPAVMISDPSLPNHTIYAPKTPPGDLSMPFISWGNGGCGIDGAGYRNFLTEIASWGYVIAANGAIGGSDGSRQSKVQDRRDGIDWAMKGGAKKYGNVDTTRIVSMGYSCGGLESMSVAYHDDRVKMLMLFNIGIFMDEKRYLLQEIKVPVAWFVGGPKDMGYLNSQKDYALLPKTLPAYLANLDTGHCGTFAATNGGKEGKAAVAYLNWQYRNNATSKAILLDPKAHGSLVADKWNVTYKNWA
ncbi:hypothetical protein WAI453_001522 [Rhynchosporium graminicola]|uniref:Dienelactone hydrolase domain-containing protein n=1 Tax=Rhynchosporium graminicola TaxID=2792576 RepID=A0A1E1KC62_9HELO|nr:uncharacterized protein RCO7_10939 [Rhynchosporium commune]